MASGGLTIKELNVLLDRLASSENRQATFSLLLPVEIVLSSCMIVFYSLDIFAAFILD